MKFVKTFWAVLKQYITKIQKENENKMAFQKEICYYCIIRKHGEVMYIKFWIQAVRQKQNGECFSNLFVAYILIWHGPFTKHKSFELFVS